MDQPDAQSERTASHVIAVTVQDNGEITEEIAHRDWVETVSIVEDEPGAPESGEAAGGAPAGKPALTRPERLVSARPVPNTEEPSDLEDPAPGTLPPVEGPAARKPLSP